MSDDPKILRSPSRHAPHIRHMFDFDAPSKHVQKIRFSWIISNFERISLNLLSFTDMNVALVEHLMNKQGLEPSPQSLIALQKNVRQLIEENSLLQQNIEEMKMNSMPAILISRLHVFEDFMVSHNVSNELMWTLVGFEVCP